jgi:hypothetical protein
LNAYNEQYACGINFGQSNRTEIALKNGNNCQSPGNGWIRTATYLNVSDGEWHNLIFSYDGAICKMYIDGILTATGNFNQGVIDHCGGELNIGTAYNLGNPFLGKIDDIAIWNRALSSSEVAQLYAAQSVNPNSIASSTPTVATNFPSGIAYQAVARDSTGQPIGNSAIGVRFSIRDSSLSGTVVYSETHNLTTNALGLFTATIGNGTAQSGTYAGINWMGPVKLLQVEVNAGSGYQLIGGQQLLSVPYANAANAAAKIKNSGLPVFPDNTSALSGGLQPGDTYRTPTGILMIVY